MEAGGDIIANDQCTEQICDDGGDQERGLLLVFMTIYASPSSQSRNELWEESSAFAQNMNHSWLLSEGFNETIGMEEQVHGCPEMARRCAMFKYWIKNNGLIDLGSSGPKFTCRRGLRPETAKSARLNQALGNLR